MAGRNAGVRLFPARKDATCPRFGQRQSEPSSLGRQSKHGRRPPLVWPNTPLERLPGTGRHWGWPRTWRSSPASRRFERDRRGHMTHPKFGRGPSRGCWTIRRRQVARLCRRSCFRRRPGHASSIVDYGRNESQMMTLRDGGLDRLFAIDWLPATDETADWSIEGCVAVLEEAVQFLGGRVNLVDDCQGGWLAVVCAGHPSTHTRRAHIARAGRCRTPRRVHGPRRTVRALDGDGRTTADVLSVKGPRRSLKSLH